MVAASVGKKQMKRTAVLAVVLVVLVLAGMFIMGRIRGKGDGTEIPGDTAEQREEYLRSVGIQVDPTSSIAEVKVPEEFDERFTEYNTMLQTTGFDLSNLRGETVKKCTYTVTNKPELCDNLSAVLLVYKGKIVAGHLLDVGTGMLYPLYETESAAQETILPVPQPAEQPEESEVIAEAAYPVD